MIEIENLQKIYISNGVQTSALLNVNFSIKEGEFCAIVGRSGCGKTTLMNIIGCMDTKTAGKYIFDGVDIGNASRKVRAEFRNRKIGYIFQSFNLIGNLTALENVAMPLGYAGVSRANRNRRAKEHLDRVGLGNRMHHMAQKLSGGEQQRVAIARALVTSPRIVLADEPTGNLDEENCSVIMELLTEINKEGMTIVLVSHDAYTTQFASRIIVMKDGVIDNPGNSPQSIST